MVDSLMTEVRNTMLLKILGVAFIGILIAFMLNTAVHLDFFYNKTYKHYPGIYKTIKGIKHGTEDFKVLSNGLTFISSGNGHSVCSPSFVKQHDMKGRIYLFDFRKPENPAIDLKMKSSEDFNRDTFGPHGLDVLEDQAKGEHLVYVVNHVPGLPDRVEKFKYLPEIQELIHMKSIFSESFWYLNSLLLSAEDSFYITNYFYYRNFVLIGIEFVGRFAMGNVLYFDGTNYSVVSSGYQGPNGLLLSKDGTHLYMVISHEERMMVFERFPDNSLRPIQSFILGSMGDNLLMSKDGQTLFLGIHPIKWKLLRHIRSPEMTSPSGVIALPLKDGKIVEDEITELFHDHGDLITASTVGIVFNDKLLIGSLVLCDLNQPMFKRQNYVDVK